MVEDKQNPHPTLALNTKVEEDFVAPLTAIRGALEILRDFPHLHVHEQQRFVETALRGCLRLETGIDQLAKTVYAAGQEAMQDPAPETIDGISEEYLNRIHVLRDQDIVELDFSDFSFSSSAIVNDFYDGIERRIEPTGRSWYILVNFRNCSVWPEAWVAFAHRGKRINATCSLGTVRYVELPADQDDASATSDPEIKSSRNAAIQEIEALRRAASG